MSDNLTDDGFMDEEFEDDFGYSDESSVDGDTAEAHSQQNAASQSQANTGGGYSQFSTFSFDDNENGIDMFDDDGNDFEPVISNRNMKKPWQVDYKIHNPGELHGKQNAMIEHLKPLLVLPTDTVTLLLRCCKWNEEGLVEKYICDPQKTLAENGVASDSVTPHIEEGDESFVCEICYSDGAEEKYLRLSCGHRFCVYCYQRYISVKAKDGESWRIKCPAPKCKMLVSEGLARLLLAGDPDALSRYNDSLNRSFVNDLDSFTWCPAPNCEFAVECHVPRSAMTTTIPTVTCSCGKAFCFNCKMDDHMPTPCVLAGKWIIKCRDDSETSNWIKANTKECTKCKTTIEKNGGCNHMTCRDCHYEFCWVCMGSWKDHGQQFYNCGRFNEDSSKNARDDISKSRAALERYLHYYTRFANHGQSIKLAREQLSNTEKNMEQLQQETTLSWIEVQFLRDAVDVLSVCRTTLRWTYALAFYMISCNQKTIFENNQSDLEMAVEELNGMVEDPMGDEKSIEERKRKIIDKASYVKSRWEILLADTMAGLQENRWQFDS